MIPKIIKNRKSLHLMIAGIGTCGICCLPFLLPIAAGVFGVSIVSFSVTKVLCAVILLFVSIMLIVVYRHKTKNKS